jgi:hypothetical protein
MKQKEIICEICAYSSDSRWGFALLGMEFGPKRRYETSVTKYQRKRRNIPEQRRPKKNLFHDICPVMA